MPLKRLFFALILLSSITSTAQYQATLSKTVPYKVNEASSFSAYSNEWNNFLLFKRTENQENIYSLVMTDNDDNIVLTNDLRVATIVEDNHFLIAGVALAGRNLTVFVESRNAKTGRNVLAMQAVDNKGGLTSEGMLVGYFDSKEPDNAGAWHITSTPDQMNIALVAQLPHEQGKPDRFMYYFMNENLTITHKGEFAVTAPDLNEISVDQFLASNEGNLYVVSRGKDNGFPVVYTADVHSGKTSTMPVIFPGERLKNRGWLAAVNPRGGLTIVGGLGDAISADFGSITKTWTFDTARPSEVKVNTISKPASGLRFRNILFNGDTYFAVAETDLDFQVIGFDTLNQKKFETLLPRHAAKEEMNAGIASGILQEKLCLLYNDTAAQTEGHAAAHNTAHMGSHNTAQMASHNTAHMGNHHGGQTLMSLSIDNEGKRGNPTGAEQVSGSGKIRRPQYFSAASDRIVTLSETPEGIRAVTFR